MILFEYLNKFEWFYLNKDWGCVILRDIDFLLKICWSIPCLHPSWRVLSWILQLITVNVSAKANLNRDLLKFPLEGTALRCTQPSESGPHAQLIAHPCSVEIFCYRHTKKTCVEPKQEYKYKCLQKCWKLSLLPKFWGTPKSGTLGLSLFSLMVSPRLCEGPAPQYLMEKQCCAN